MAQLSRQKFEDEQKQKFEDEQKSTRYLKVTGNKEKLILFMVTEVVSRLTLFQMKHAGLLSIYTAQNTMMPILSTLPSY